MAEQFFMSVGLDSPVKRFAAGSVAVGGALVTLQPEMMFSGGSPRPWSIVSQDAEATPIPWWLVAVGAGAAIGTLF